MPVEPDFFAAAAGAREPCVEVVAGRDVAPLELDPAVLVAVFAGAVVAGALDDPLADFEVVAALVSDVPALVAAAADDGFVVVVAAFEVAAPVDFAGAEVDVVAGFDVDVAALVVAAPLVAVAFVVAGVALVAAEVAAFFAFAFFTLSARMLSARTLSALAFAFAAAVCAWSGETVNASSASAIATCSNFPDVRRIECSE